MPRGQELLYLLNRHLSISFLKEPKIFSQCSSFVFSLPFLCRTIRSRYFPRPRRGTDLRNPPCTLRPPLFLHYRIHKCACNQRTYPTRLNGIPSVPEAPRRRKTSAPRPPAAGSVHTGAQNARDPSKKPSVPAPNRASRRDPAGSPCPPYSDTCLRLFSP